MTKRFVAAALFLGAMTFGSAAFAGDDAKKPAPPAKTDKPADTKPAPVPEPVAVPKCRAVEADDATKSIGEAEEKSATKCTKLLMDKVKEAKCGDAANKGKKIAFTEQFDHMVGTGKLAKKMKDAKQSLTCPKK